MRIRSSIIDIFSTFSSFFTSTIGLIIIFSWNIPDTYAQNQPIYNQFFLNPFIYNPAYAGKNPNSMGYLNFRKQWAGLKDAPTTYTFLYDTEFKKGISFGIIAQNDTRGIVSTSSGQFTLGYGIKFSDQQGLRFGLSAGAGSNSLNLDSDDQAVATAKSGSLFLIGRIGLNLYFKDINLSFSVPDLIKRKIVSPDALSPIEFDPLDQFIVIGSAKINLIPMNNTLTFSPYLLYRGASDGTNYFEAVGKFDIKEIVWIGGSYRQNYGIVGIAGFKIKNKLTIGYGYEIPIGSKADISFNTHEIQLSILLGKDKVLEAEKKKERLAAKREKQRKAREAVAKRRKLEADKKAREEAEKEQQEQDAKEKAAREAREKEQKEAEALLEQERQLADKQAGNEKEDNQLTAQQLREKEQQEAKALLEKERIEQLEREKQLAKEKAEKERLERLAKEKANNKTPKKPTKTIKKEKHVIFKRGKDKDELGEDHYVIIGSFIEKVHAEEYTRKLKRQGYAQAGYGFSSERKRYYVHLFKSPSASEAREERDEYRKLAHFHDAWHLEVQADDVSEIIKGKENKGRNIEEKTDSLKLTQQTPIDDHSPKLIIKKGDHILELNQAHYVVVGAFESFEHAEDYSNQLFDLGYQSSFGYSSEKKLYYIYLFKGKTAEETRMKRDELRKINEFKDAWYLLVEE